MHHEALLRQINPAHKRSAAEVVLRQARRLHRSALSGSLSTALPVLRRMVTVGVFPGFSLKELFRCRGMIRRKHVLRMLAREARFASWEAFRPALHRWDPSAADHFEFEESGYAFLNLWFSNEQQAQEFVAKNGGRVFCIGAQAVVVPVTGCDCSPLEHAHGK